MPSDADTKSRTLVLSRIFDAPRSILFEAWTTPEQVAAWWGPMGYVTTDCDMDIRPGGSFRVGMRSPEGVVHSKVGTYREIVSPERVVFTFAWADRVGTPGHQTLVTVTLEELGAKTRLTLRQEVFDTIESCDGHRIGWTSCLDRFDHWLGTPETGRSTP
jgi:uncharacterized protein YndB with AHSA1/START domain